MKQISPARLLSEMNEAIGEMSATVAEDHGFGLFTRHDGSAEKRRAQARTVLLAEHVLTEATSRSGRPVVLMKGLEVAQLYPSVFMRPFRDVDVLVDDARRMWDEHVAAGYRPRASRQIEIDHHHLPALAAPFGSIGLEVHKRPNVPGWVDIDPTWVLSTAVGSRTGIEGVLRPRDDVHALLVALHAWTGGFTRRRDLYDAVLLAATSEVPVDRTAKELGLGACWHWTIKLAEALIVGRASTPMRVITSVTSPRHAGVSDRRRVRLLAPFLVANPVRVVRGHLAEYQLSRSVRKETELDTE